ncbi:MAG: ATP-binding protein [Myxococcota bacterium]
MSLNSGLIFASAFVHFLSAPLPYILYRRTGGAGERLFAILHVVTGLYCLAAGWFSLAPTAADGDVPLRLQFALGCILILVFLRFAEASIGGRESPRVWRAILVFLALSLVPVLSGAMVDPGAVTLSTHHWSGGPLRRTMPSLALVLSSLVGLAVVFASAVSLYRRAANRVEGRTFALALGTVGVGWTFDFCMRCFRTDLAVLSDHCISVAVLALGNVLLHRFVQQSADLRARTKELASENARLTRLEKRLVRREQLATVGELSAVIAQEVRAPLGAIRHAVETLSNMQGEPETRELLLSELDEGNDRLNRLVRDLLAYAKPVAPQFEAVSLRTLLTTVLEPVEADASYSVSVNMSDAPDTIEADPRLLRMAFEQVVTNALQAMPSGGGLRVRAELGQVGPSPALAVHFSDTGEGMDSLVRSRAVDPFFTTRSSGTGLGLAIVDRLVTLHGGRLLFGDDDEGATVSVFLPAKPPAA